MVECPVCRTSNAPGSLHCVKCNASFQLEADTLVDPPANPPKKPTTTSDQQETIAGATGWSDPIQPSIATPESGPLSAGMVLGDRYEILKALGEGGMGAVYKARDLELGRLLALKVIRPDLANRPDILRRFKQELILARQVTHKNVVRIFDLGMAGGYKFITMDYIEGRDLKTVLEHRTKLPPEEAVPIFQQICRGLEAAHTEGVVHRDLKPQNIMVDDQARVWVMDFGLARSLELSGMTRTGALLGTPDYMSPEQARSQKVDARSDLFSLGVIFYETLTGQLPYLADTVMAAMLKRCQEAPIPPVQLDPSIPRHLNDMVMKCLAIHPDERYPTVGEVLADLSGRPPAVPEDSGMRTGVTFGPAAAESAMTLTEVTPGAQFGPRYLIEAVIGEGGMGKVYKAQDRDLDRTVALKLVRPELASNPAAMQRFKQELLLASRISHKNILRIHDLGDVGGVKFISMAYVEGKDLHDLIQENHPLPLERALEIVRQLAAALDAAHTEGVVHRDLKPRNVLVDQSEHVYVSDFGLAKSIEAESLGGMTRTGEVLGTPRYMSPEQAESKPADHRSDLYSLGVIFYEMVTGEAPFGGDSALQLMYKHVKDPPKNPKLLNAALPDQVAAIILKCLEKDPAQRYQSARELLDDLESGTPPTRVVRLRMAETGYPKWLMGTALGVLLLLAAIFLITPLRNKLLGRWGGAPARVSTAVPDKYLAVLPLKKLGDDEALKYAADGVVESLSAQLFQLKNLHVASASAVEAVEAALKKGSVEFTIDESKNIAHDLGVNLVVDGTVQGSGDNIRIIMRLEDVKNGKQLWSKEYTVLRRDLLSTENSIYSDLVSALDIKPSDEDLARGALRSTGDYGAYELYLKGREVVRREPNAKGYNAALKFYSQAIRQDSRFALAYAGMADTSMALYESTKEDSWAQKALSAAQQARQLNPSLPEVHWALGTIYLKTGKYEQAIAETKLGLELAPSADESYRRLGHVYLAAGRKDAIAAYEKAAEINPFYWFNFNYLGAACANLGEGEKAVDAFRRVTELAPDWAPGYNNRGGAYFQQGKWSEAVAAYRKSLSLAPNGDAEANLGTAFYYLGLYSDSARALEKAVQMDPRSHANIAGLADAYRQLGQHDKAKASYETAIKLALKEYQVNPRDAVNLGSLALYYGKKGDLNAAQNFIAKARDINANNNVLIYNDAVIQSLSGKSPDALKLLREAVDKGFPVDMVKSDADLTSLRTSPEFQKLINDFSKKPK
ncbi:MAG: hypothetical protein DMG57_40310 [Acidobacteria bacterium]|nr:MAG: hypothetical protein DMG57_40310 [Acidobacteriota bacterium]